MALTPAQQAFEQIIRAKRILIATREHAAPDTLAAAVSCHLFMKKIGKEADVVAPGFEPDKAPSFLPAKHEIKSGIGAMRAFHILLDVQDVPLGELMYDVRDKKLEITVIPKAGEWSERHVSLKPGENRYDLIITTDAPDLASLGALARNHADFFYRTTVINIDCDPGNEHWGQINLVNLNAVATTETLFELFAQWNRHAVDEDLATALLAGMIAKTRSFRTLNVTPRTLSAASQLIAMGARREEIVHGLWRTRSVPTLKLWGRILSRLEHDRAAGLVWAILTRQDFLETGSGEEALEGVVSELVSYVSETKVIALMYESLSDAALNVVLFAQPPFSAAELARPFGAHGTRTQATFTYKGDRPLVESVKSIIDQLRQAIIS